MALDLGATNVDPVDPGPSGPHLEPAQELFDSIRVPLTVRLNPSILEVPHPPSDL
jgi:hypothetical protein